MRTRRRAVLDSDAKFLIEPILAYSLAEFSVGSLPMIILPWTPPQPMPMFVSLMKDLCLLLHPLSTLTRSLTTLLSWQGEGLPAYCMCLRTMTTRSWLICPRDCPVIIPTVTFRCASKCVFYLAVFYFHSLLQLFYMNQNHMSSFLLYIYIYKACQKHRSSVTGVLENSSYVNILCITMKIYLKLMRSVVGSMNNYTQTLP